MEKQDDSFKYLGHETLGELVAELRNKLGSVTTLADLIKLEKINDDTKELDDSFIKNLKSDTEENLVKSIPLILRYLNEFGQYDLDQKKK